MNIILHVVDVYPLNHLSYPRWREFIRDLVRDPRWQKLTTYNSFEWCEYPSAVKRDRPEVTFLSNARFSSAKDAATKAQIAEEILRKIGFRYVSEQERFDQMDLMRSAAEARAEVQMIGPSQGKAHMDKVARSVWMVWGCKIIENGQTKTCLVPSRVSLLTLAWWKEREELARERLAISQSGQEQE